MNWTPSPHPPLSCRRCACQGTRIEWTYLLGNWQMAWTPPWVPWLNRPFGWLVVAGKLLNLPNHDQMVQAQPWGEVDITCDTCSHRCGHQPFDAQYLMPVLLPNLGNQRRGYLITYSHSIGKWRRCCRTWLPFRSQYLWLHYPQGHACPVQHQQWQSISQPTGLD